MPTGYDPLTVWGLVLVVGVATFAIRASFVYLFGRIDTVPPRLKRALQFVPPAVFAALVAPSLLVVDGAVDAAPVAVSLADAVSLTDVSVSVGNERLLAGLVAAAVAWVTEDVFATIVVGMATLWVLRFVV